MQEHSEHEVTCPICKKKIYLGGKMLSKVFCGEEALCTPPEARHNEPDCKEYKFCSEECLESFSVETPECSYTPGWKRLMGKINRVSKSSGLAGVRPHNLHKC